MKIQQWIKNLKVPRLIIEAVLIFGSVYFALILEADRNRDFEREVVIGELESILEMNKQDSIDLMLYFGEGFQDFNSIYARDSIIFNRLKKNEKLDLEFRRDIKAGFWGNMPSSELFKFDQIQNTILSEHRFLIQNRDLIDKMNEINFWMVWLKNFNEAHSKGIMEIKQTFKSKMRFEENVDDPNVDVVTTSELYFNTMSDILKYRKTKLEGSKKVLKFYSKLNELLLEEIEAQKQAIVGIF